MECTCLTGLGNTGVPNCQAVFDLTKQLVFVPYFNNDGSINGIDLEAVGEIDQAFLDDKIQALDPDSRWYPTPELKNVVDERADDIVETFEDSTGVFIQEGARTFTGLLIGQSPQFKGQLDKWRCNAIGVYFIDKAGNLVGDNARQGFLDPVRIQRDSLSPRLIKGTDTTIQKVEVNFTVDQLMDDANLSYISSGNITADLTGAPGLLDAIAGTVANITTDGFTVPLSTLYGGVYAKGEVKGLEVADFEVFNQNTSSSVTPTSVTEDPDGTYIFVIPTQTSGDVLRVGNKTTGTLDKGFDIKQFEVTIP